MDMELILKELIKQEEVKLKKYVLFMLLKFSHCVKRIESDANCLPLLLIQNNRITLVYKEESEDREYIFTDYEEILIVLQNLFSNQKVVYFHYEVSDMALSEEELSDRIDDALLDDDEALFLHYSSILTKKRGEQR